MAHRADLEQLVSSLIAAGRQTDAVTATIRGQGPEIRDFLCALHRRDDVAADEVFACWAEGVWRGLPSFSWQCSLRTWGYAVARHASLRYRRDQQRRCARQVPVPEVSALLDLACEARSATPWYAQAGALSRFAALRDLLSPDDQMLLLLRVDRGLSWNDIARITLQDTDDSPVSEQLIARNAGRLRKHFQSVKDRLYTLGREQGFMPVHVTAPDLANLPALPPRPRRASVERATR